MYSISKSRAKPIRVAAAKIQQQFCCQGQKLGETQSSFATVAGFITNQFFSSFVISH